MSVSYGGDKITFDDGTSIASGLSHFRNRIINGDMRIDQRNAGASVTPSNATTVYGVDRFSISVSQNSKCTVQQDAGAVTPPAGFSDYYGLTVGSSANVTVGAGDYFVIQQRIEGNNLSDLNFGTSNAKTFTISFWVRSSLTGSFGFALQNGAQTRSYGTTYTINAANTWEYKTITVAGDTTGTWVTNNETGLVCSWGLGVGSTYSIAASNSWTTTTSPNGFGVTGTVQLIQTNSATFYFTGVQLEVGSYATTFERRPYGTELQLCQRYYQTIASGNAIYFANGSYFSATYAQFVVSFVTSMRSAPTLAASSGTDYFRIVANGGTDSFNSLTISGAGINSTMVYNNSEVSGTTGHGIIVQTNNSASYIAFQSEL